jgi:hypothetical protein
MIGSRLGVKFNFVGSAVGSSADDEGIAGLVGVSKDATSNIFCPATLTEWNTVLSFNNILSGPPSALHLLQEVAGSPADTIGTFTLTPFGTITYSNAVSGWSRKSINLSDGVSGGLKNTAVGLPDISTNSCMMLMYMTVPPDVPTNRTLCQLGPNFGSRFGANVLSISVGHKRINCVLDPTNAAGADDTTTNVRPVILKINRTGGNATLYTNAEKLVPTFAGNVVTGKNIQFGGDNVNSDFPPICSCLYWCTFFNGAAEMTDAQIRSLLQSLGWTVAW